MPQATKLARTPRPSRPEEQHEQPRPGLLSQSDPEAERPIRRPPIWLIVVLLLVVGFIALHLASGPHL